jgi:hypothetical protein
MNRPSHASAVGHSAVTPTNMFGAKLIVCRGPLSKA